METSNLSLTVYNTTTGSNTLTDGYINDTSGSFSTSNMQKIDVFSDEVSGSFLNISFSSIVIPPGGRLTLSSASPVTTAGISSASMLYYLPYIYNKIQLYDISASAWLPYTFSELSLDLTSSASETVYDIFVYDNSGSPTLESNVWGSRWARTNNIVYQDGRLVKSGSMTRLYLGTIYIYSDGLCHDTQYRRFVWNNYNQVAKQVVALNTTASWSYSGSDWRVYNNSVSNTMGRFVMGQSDVVFGTSNQSATITASGTSECSVGVLCKAMSASETIISDATDSIIAERKYNVQLGSYLSGIYSSEVNAPIGYNWISMCEKAGASASMTVYGTDRSGKILLKC